MDARTVGRWMWWWRSSATQRLVLDGVSSQVQGPLACQSRMSSNTHGPSEQRNKRPANPRRLPGPIRRARRPCLAGTTCNDRQSRRQCTCRHLWLRLIRATKSMIRLEIPLDRATPVAGSCLLTPPLGGRHESRTVMQDPLNVDLKAKTNEAGWQDALDRFWLAATPKLFEWLGWVAALAALTFVQRKSHSLPLMLLLGFCYCSLLLYFIAFFCRFQFTGFPVLKTAGRQLVASICLSFGLALAAYWIVRQVVPVIAQVAV